MKIGGRTKLALLVAAGVAALLLLVQALTYVYLAEAAMPWTLSWPGEEARSGFVCISDRSWEALSPLHRTEIDIVLERQGFQTVYHSESEIPHDSWALRPSDPARRQGLKDGFILRWNVLARGTFWFKAERGFWWGELAAGRKLETFVWFFGTWLRVWTTAQDLA